MGDGVLWVPARSTAQTKVLEGGDVVFLSFTSVSILVFGFYRQPKPDPTPLVTARYNVFQNDEFDVFSRDSVDVSRIQKGKR